MNTMLRSTLPTRLLDAARNFRPRRPRPRTIAGLLLVLAALLIGGYLWLRDSSLVAIRTVTVLGTSGRDARQIRRALIAAARRMTTLDVNTAALKEAVAAYPEVKAIHVSTEFPHGLRIVVVEVYAVATITAGGQQIAVAPDGVLLHAGAGSSQLPELGPTVAPGTTRVTDRHALDELAVLTAAPYQFIPRIARAREDAIHGVVLQLRSGPAVYFGDTSELGAKWRALVLVLADPGAGGATYIDVSDPLRPAAGGGAAAAQAAIAAGLAQTGTATGAVRTPAPTGTGTATTSTSTTSSGTATGTTNAAAPPTTTAASTTATATGQTPTSTASSGGAAPGG